jgi:hypothetical protein
VVLPSYGAEPNVLRAIQGGASVKTYVSRVLTKLDCANRVQAALLVRDAGVLPTAEDLR